MNLLPFENITYRTNLAPDEVFNRLKDVVEPSSTLNITKYIGNYQKEFEGSLGSDYFAIKRNGAKSSFNPETYGVIMKDDSGSKIEVKMRLNTVVLTFFLIWFGVISIIFFALLIESISTKTINPIILAPLGLLLFGYILITKGFKNGSFKSKWKLAEVMRAKIDY